MLIIPAASRIKPTVPSPMMAPPATTDISLNHLKGATQS
jgi:hypothetical protein